jgi:hypothetical protein
MTLIPYAAVLAAALVFIAVSAVMNALFLSSLGRTPVEIGLLAAVSVAVDVTKAVLPVVLMRAVMLRAWGHAAPAAALLLLVILLSLTSGAGFTASTRGAVTAGREAQSEQLAARKQELRDIDSQLSALMVTRPRAVIEAELATLLLDRRSLASKSCEQPVTTTHREYCKDVYRLKVELVSTNARDKSAADRRMTLAAIEMLQRSGAAAEIDPQASALAELTGFDQKQLRVGLTILIAVLLELGSAILVLLAAGPMLRGWREPGEEPEPEPIPATLPLQADRSHWQRQRSKLTTGAIERIDDHAR